MYYASEANFSFESCVEGSETLSAEMEFYCFWENIYTPGTLLSSTASLDSSQKGATMFNAVVVYYKCQV